VAPEGVDAVLDGAGGEALTASLELLDKRERIGTIADIGAAGRLGVRAIGSRRSADRLADLVGLYSLGELKVFIWREFPLRRAADAHRESEHGHLRGKIVLTV
jgi:enoyl reductase